MFSINSHKTLQTYFGTNFLITYNVLLSKVLIGGYEISLVCSQILFRYLGHIVDLVLIRLYYINSHAICTVHYTDFGK